MDKDLHILGKIIKAGRKKNHLTQIELANKVFLSESYIKDLERGRTTPSVDTLFRLINCLHIDIQPFFYGISHADPAFQELQCILVKCNAYDYNVLIATARAMISGRKK